MIFVGVDWAEAHHDVHVQNEAGKRVGGGRLPEGVDGIARFRDLVGGCVDEPGEVVIGIETDRGLFVTALVAAGYQVFVLTDMVRTDRHNHWPVAADSETVQAIKILARAHQTMIWSRGRQTNGLRSTLRVLRSTRRVRRRAEPVWHRQVSQELRRHVADHPGVGHQTGRVGPLRPYPTHGRRHLPVGLRPLNASPGARRFYDTHRAAGDTHHAALRALGNRLVGILHGCLEHHTVYDESIAWAHRSVQKLSEAA